MDKLIQQEKEKYERLWDLVPSYGKSECMHSKDEADCTSDCLMPIFFFLFQKEFKKDDKVIDFGCGNGRKAYELKENGLKVFLFDLCNNSLDPVVYLHTLGEGAPFQFVQGCLWDIPESLPMAEWMLCFDVLEHLPPNRVSRALSQMSKRIKRGGLISIALVDDRFGSLIGEKLHLTVKSSQWWKEMITRYFVISHEVYTSPDYLIWAIETKK